MKWRGESMFAEFGLGTQILFYERRYIAGEPAAHLTEGDEVQICYGGGDQKWLEAKIALANSDEAILEITDGTKWRMTPRSSGELPIGIRVDYVPTQEWVIRAQA